MAKKTDYFSSFCKISKAFGSTLKKDDLLDLIVQSAIDSLEAKAACLFLADEEKGLSVPVAQKGLSDDYLHAEPMKIETVIRDLMAAGGYIAFPDATSDPRLDHHGAKKAEGIASILVVPVMVQNRGIGVLSLYTAKRREFSDDEVAFLQALADQGGIAIQHARLYERINQNADLYFRLAASINSSRELNQIFHTLSAEIGEAFNMKAVSIRLYNPETKRMELAASHGLSKTFLDKGPISAGKSQVVSEILAGKTVIIEDTSTDTRLQYPEESRREGIVSVLVVPIQSQDKVIGELRLYSAVKRKFPDHIIKMLTALAHQGGVAIEKEQLLRRIRMNSEIFNDLAVAMDSTLDVKQILHTLSADVADVFGVKGVSIRLLDEDKKTLRLVTSYGLSETYLDKGPLYAEKNISRALQNRPAVIRNIAESRDVQDPEALAAEGIAALLTVPINAREGVIGVMRLYSETVRDFTEDDVILAMALAHQGGLAIQNASMYLKLQEDKKDLEEEIWSHRAWF